MQVWVEEVATGQVTNACALCRGDKDGGKARQGPVVMPHCTHAKKFSWAERENGRPGALRPAAWPGGCRD